jgi:acyl-CoA thioesterase-2
MPNVLPPEVLLTDFEQAKQIKDSNPKLYERLTIIHPNAIEFRPVESFRYFTSQSAQPYRHLWMRAQDRIELDLPMQHQLLAYASDYNLLSTAVLPHLEQTGYENLFMASLDHAMWFHRDFRMDEWLLYALDSPSASGSRGFTRGNIFNRAGHLVASVVQEGLIREFRR